MATWRDKISAPGVIKYVAFDAAALAGVFGDVMGVSINPGQTNPVAPVLDTTVKSCGNNSIKFTIPSLSSAGPSGQWWTNFSDDRLTQFGEGQFFSCQYEIKMSPYWFTHIY